ncbi:uncharacterized protein LOC126551933 [Aphis gossypii]|uniref:uncharacterized protein LOC126551933 n=1 Tax=Aphis gossypii TaxID=80765 RepID=UPI0021593B98|nr:uncharacterized protein LOC126551933 [Aphis gossypii]
MPVCVFEGCFSGSKRKDKPRDPNIHLHRFPKDPELRKIWTKQIIRHGDVNNINCETGVVCSLHFSPHYFAEKSYAQLVASYSPKCSRRLKPDALPMTKLGLEYDDIPYNCRVESLGTPPIKSLPSIIRTPSGNFKVTESEKDINHHNDKNARSVCSKLFNDLCDELEVGPLSGNILMTQTDEPNHK